jgi:hypothetical protein
VADRFEIETVGGDQIGEVTVTVCMISDRRNDTSEIA